MKNWLAGNTPNCSSPSYVRDNIHVSLLAKAYAQFLADLPDTPGFSRLNPSGYAESQGAFSMRLAQEMRQRLDLPCPLSSRSRPTSPSPASASTPTSSTPKPSAGTNPKPGTRWPSSTSP